METSHREGRAALDAVQAAWNAAGTPWNAEALANVYTADAMLFGGRPGHYVGQEALRGYFASYDGVILQGSMQLVEQQIVPLAPGVLLAQGFVDFAFHLAGDQHTQSRLRTTLVMQQKDGRWKILQHHFSPAPAAPPLGN